MLRVRELGTALAAKTPAALTVALAAAYALALGLGHLLPRYDAIVFPLVAWAMFRLLDPVGGRRLLLCLLATGTLLAVGVLAHLWTTGHEGRSAVVLGILPFSDAGAFYGDAERMLHGLRFTESARRPLYVAFASTVLRWSGDDLRRLLAVSTALYGAALGLMSWEMRRAHGRAAGLVVFVLGYLWIRRFTGFVASEALAFPLGAIAFVLLVRTADAASERPREAIAPFALAMLVLTLALVARPGPLLVIPALLAWPLWAFRGRIRALACAAGASGVAGAVLATRLLSARIADAPTFGDYPAILYGLLHRRELGQAVLDHPELAALAPEEHARAILRIVATDVSRDPALLVVGPGEALVGFLAGPHGLFSFVWTNPDDHVLEDGPLVRRIVAEHGWAGPVRHWVHELGAWSLLNAIVMGALGVLFVVLLLAAARGLYRKRRDGRPRVVLFVLTGIVASSLFAPTWIGEGMQMEAAVFGFVPAALALGLLADGGARDAAPAGGLRRLSVATLGALLVVAVLIAATCVVPGPTQRGGCTAGTMSARVNRSTRILLRPPGGGLPDASSLALNLQFLQRHNPTLVSSIRAVAREGDAVAMVYDACSERTRVVFGPADSLAAEGWTLLPFEPQADPGVARVLPR